MQVTNRLKNQHLLWRAAFGPMAENVAQLDSITPQQLWLTLLQTSAGQPIKLNIASNPLQQNENMNLGTLSADAKRMLLKQSRDELKVMNTAWLSFMINSKAQLLEKMSFFWHGHFACRTNNSFFAQALLNTIRVNALGNFGTMLKAVSKEPAMLQFLNNQQNKKGNPNENFAREVMELFTLGRGNYTETDIKEAARAFTGWGFDKTGGFVFRKNQHDDGEKIFFNQTGNFDGDDILDILLKNKQTAYFITQKIYSYFVNTNVDEAKIKALSNDFYKSNYNITQLLTQIFTSTWFYDEKNIATKIKSPVELLVGIRRYLPLSLDNDDAQILFEKVLGQILFYPPNVAGWPGGKSWIDSSTLMVRLQIPKVLSANEVLEIRAKTDDDVNMGMMEEKRIRLGKKAAFAAAGISATIDWNLIYTTFAKTERPNLLLAILNSLLQSQGNINSTLLANYTDNVSRENYIKSIVIIVMSTPEYQLC